MIMNQKNVTQELGHFLTGVITINYTNIWCYYAVCLHSCRW